MYLARKRINYRDTHFIIRHSFKGPGYMISRDVLDLGTNPGRFIHYPGGNSYYIDPCVEEALHEHGLEASQNDLDRLFFDFFTPETRRLIDSFQRRARKNPKNRVQETLSAPHKFDKRRYYYLRFGSRRRQYINRVDAKIFRPLQNKSRDEIEQYFHTEERILKPREIPDYISTIFELKSFVPRAASLASLVEQLDVFFTDRLCGINSDRGFMAGVPGFPGLPWLIGEQFTLADISVMPTIVRMEDLGLAKMWSDLPRVTDWYKRLQARPTFATTYYEGTRALGPNC